MKETTVSVTKFGIMPIRPFASALAALNIQTGEDREFDYQMCARPHACGHHTDLPLA